FSISCLLPFQSCSASGFCVTVSAEVSNTPFQLNFTNSIFSQIPQPPVWHGRFRPSKKIV
ncbi:unnamed protein product, partial [Brassica rapa subsp. trilocularis]